MSTNYKPQLCCGVVTITRAEVCIEIAYEEHESRNGRLLVSHEGHALTADELSALADLLRAEEMKLAKGRARYADMLMAYYALQYENHSPNQPIGGGGEV
jgi:hypothetical protein